MRRIVLILLLFPFQSGAQSYTGTHAGVSLGLLVNFGSHVNSVGLNLKAYYTNYFTQLNAGSSVTFNLNGYGERRHFVESRTAVGLVLLAGKKDQPIDFLLDGLNHQTAYRYGIAYNYLFYFDNAGTSQLSGGWAVHLKRFSLYFENDVFGGQARDRFRTGHLMLSYRFEQIRFLTGLYIWTGETANSVWIRDAGPGTPNGYRSLENLPYGKSSHGVLYGGFIANTAYGNQVHFKTGTDSEQIRHFFQNRLAHDLILLPASVKRHTPHYPRLNSEGKPVFKATDRRADRFYLQLGLNENWSN